MDVKIPGGKYVLAVSGGVDSMVLLDLLAKLSDVELIVAHFNHGIRQDSNQGEALVSDITKRCNLVYEVGRANLGPQASEDDARQARYEFLEAVMRKHEACKIITAHHQDDWIETVLINVVRGTGRQGVSSILNNSQVLRPLINVPKVELLQYAKQKGLEWSEDSTNQNQNYLRNYLRVSVLPSLNHTDRQKLLNNLDKVAKINIKIDEELATLSHNQYKKLNRQEFSGLPTDVGQELVVFLLRQIGVRDYDKRTVDRLSMAIKTAKSNSIHPVKDRTYLDVKFESAVFVTP